MASASTENAVGACQVSVYGHDRWARSTTCGKPVKRDGMCGIHAAAKERRAKNDQQRDAKRERGKQIAAALTDLLGLPVYHHGYGPDDGFTISATHVYDWWAKTSSGEAQPVMPAKNEVTR